MKLNRLARVWMSAGILSGLAIVIKLISFFPIWIENHYSTTWYPRMAAFFRAVFGWIPFSIGDLFYGYIIILLVIIIIRVIVYIVQKKWSIESVLYIIGKMVNFSLNVYIVFNVLWGFNYTRAGIAYQLALNPQPYSTESLVRLTDSLIAKLNTSKRELEFSAESKILPTHQEVFNKAFLAYQIAENQYPFLDYRHKSLKASLYGRAGNYLGFLGYYNPFTGEAQVNISIPEFLIPYVCCHEIAHQLGYGSESEANFVAFLAIKNFNDPLFQYSMYFDLYNYANSALYDRDTAAARHNYQLLDTLVKKDMITYKDFLIKYKNPVEPLISSFYNIYLKANQQEKGIESYSEVIAWLIAYEEKYRKL